jgi:hypothetical protein
MNPGFELAIVAAEGAAHVPNELPMPAIVMGVGTFVLFGLLLWVTTWFNPDR